MTETVDLSDNYLESSGAVCLAAMLRDNTFIMSLVSVIMIITIKKIIIIIIIVALVGANRDFFTIFSLRREPIIIIRRIIVIIIIVVPLVGANRDFLQSPHCAANRLQHVCSSGPSAIWCRWCSVIPSMVMMMTTPTMRMMMMVMIAATDNDTNDVTEESSRSVCLAATPRDDTLVMSLVYKSYEP